MVKIAAPKVEVLTPLDGDAILKHLELCARNCYKSEDKITADSARQMVRKLLELGHEAMIEHYNLTVKLTCDMGVYKDLTRHRHVSYAIESTRYCNYSKGKFGNELTVMKPCHIKEGTPEYQIWLSTMETIEKNYNAMTANLREWRHIFKLRCAPAAHPTVQEVMKMLLGTLKRKIPVIFDDICKKKDGIGQLGIWD